MWSMKQLSNRYFYSPLRIDGCVVISFTCSRSPTVFWNSPLSPSSPIQPLYGCAVTPISSTNRDVIPIVANTLSAFVLTHIGINYQLRLSMHYRWNPLKHSPCSDLQYSWVTCVTLSNFCNISQLILSTHPLLLYQPLSPYQTFFVLSNFCHFLTPCYPFSFYVIYAPVVHTANTALSPVLSFARSLRQYTFPTHQVSCHRAILTIGNRDMAGGFHEEQPVTFIPFPRSTNITHLLPKTIPPAHMTKLRNSHPPDFLHTTPLGHL